MWLTSWAKVSFRCICLEYIFFYHSPVCPATLPTRTDELLAIFVSEATAGFTGGLASRLVASLIGDTKRDGGFLKGTTTGTYFGVRAAAKSASLLLGFSPPVATLIADIAGSVVAESAKVIGRKSAEDRDFTLNEWMRGDITDVDESSLELRETIGWVALCVYGCCAIG